MMRVKSVNRIMNNYFNEIPQWIDPSTRIECKVAFDWLQTDWKWRVLGLLNVRTNPISTVNVTHICQKLLNLKKDMKSFVTMRDRETGQHKLLLHTSLSFSSGRAALPRTESTLNWRRILGSRNVFHLKVVAVAQTSFWNLAYSSCVSNWNCYILNR